MHWVIRPGVKLDEPDQIIDGADGHHLARVVRVRVGEQIALLDNAGRGRLARVASVGSSVWLNLEDELPVSLDCGPRFVVAQSMVKGDRFEEVLQHGTEIGASAFIPIIASRSISRPDERAVVRKNDRWRQIIHGAAEQSHRNCLPELHESITWSTLVSSRDWSNNMLVLDTSGEPLCSIVCSLRGLSEITVAVGPEGGFTPEELAMARRQGARVISLGTRVLRTETAALVALAQLTFALDS